jgi:Ca2+-binding EF-hand superfamily protein
MLPCQLTRLPPCSPHGPLQLLDDNMDGFVDKDELKALFVKANIDTRGAIEVPSDALLKQMIAEAGIEGDQMSFDDFAALMEQLPTVKT